MAKTKRKVTKSASRSRKPAVGRTQATKKSSPAASRAKQEKYSQPGAPWWKAHLSS
jgi:hypothetical protein